MSETSRKEFMRSSRNSVFFMLSILFLQTKHSTIKAVGEVTGKLTHEKMANFFDRFETSI